VTFSNWTLQPFATIPSVAQIVSVTDSQHVVLSQAAVNTTNAYIMWGTDNVPAINACILAAAQSNLSNGTAECTLPAGNYFLATAPYYTLPPVGDDGAYGQPAGGSGATFTTTVTNGRITGYTVTSAGSGYVPNSTLLTTLSGGCGSQLYSTDCGQGYLTARTDSGGHVTSMAIVYPGFGYQTGPTGTVNAKGGDGAAAAATLTGSTMNTPAMTSPGAGYVPNSTLPWFALGGGCTTIKTVGGTATVGKGTVMTDSNGQATGTVTVTTNATGCANAPTIIFGSFACNSGTAASPSWGQCTNLDPLTPPSIPVQILLNGNVSLKGKSASLFSVWDRRTVDSNEPAMIGGALFGGEISGLTFGNGFIGILGASNPNTFSLKNLTFYTGIGIWTPVTDLGFTGSDLTFYSYASWVNGGTWQHRTDWSAGWEGFWNAESLTNVIVTSGYYSISSAIDDWFASTFYHPEFSAGSTDFPETCKFPQTPNQRQTSAMLDGGLAAGNLMCYRGITSVGLALLSPDSGGGGGQINNLTAKGLSRYVFYGAYSGILNQLSCEGCTPLTVDPYRAAAVQEGGIVLASKGASINYFNWAAGTVNRPIWSIPEAGAPASSSWSNVSGRTFQNFDGSSDPNYQNLIPFQFGISVGNISTTGGTVDFNGHRSNGAGPNYMGSWRTLASSTDGIQYLGSDGSTNVMDMSLSGVNVHEPFTAPSVKVGSGTALSGSAGNGGYAQETTNATKTGGHCVQFDGNGNTVDAGAPCNSGGGGVGVTNTPAWLTYLGDGSDGANTNASGLMSGDYYYTNFTVPYGSTVSAGFGGLTIHATGTCTIAGQITANSRISTAVGTGGGGGGGGGGGTSAGAAGNASNVAVNGLLQTVFSGGTGGTSSGGNGGNSSGAFTANKPRAIVLSAGTLDGFFIQGGVGGLGNGNSYSGTSSGSGVSLTLICGSITGTDGTHVGTIDASGQPGAPSTANNVGANGGGGGGVVLLSSQKAVTQWPNVYVAGGGGGLATVPNAISEGGSCNSPAKATLGVTGGALSSCTVVQAGAGCGTGAGVTFVIQGGGGTGGTVTPTWSGGALASCAASGGSGYTAATYTGAGKGGDGAPGIAAEFQNW
jgi:hypothetical protein